MSNVRSIRPGIDVYKEPFAPVGKVLVDEVEYRILKETVINCVNIAKMSPMYASSSYKALLYAYTLMTGTINEDELMHAAGLTPEYFEGKVDMLKRRDLYKETVEKIGGKKERFRSINYDRIEELADEIWDKRMTNCPFVGKVSYERFSYTDYEGGIKFD